jgi:hypothetical protein
VQRNIKTILSPSVQSQPHHMSAGVIVGIAIGSFTFLLIVVSMVYYVKAASLRAAKLQEKRNYVEDSDTGVAELEFRPQAIVQEIDGAQSSGQEIDGCEHYGHEISGNFNFAKELDSKQYGAQELPMGEDHRIELPG